MDEKEIIAEVMKELYFDSLFNEEAEHIEKAIRLTISKLSQQNKNTTAKPITSPNRKQMGETGSADSLRGEELKDG